MSLTFAPIVLATQRYQSMRKFLLYFTYTLLFFLFHTSIAQSQLQKIYLNPKAPASEKQSEFVDSIRFIPLEIKEGIEVSAYNNVAITEKYILITEYVDRTMLLYLKNGAFIKKINFKKLGEEFFPNYDEHNNQIVFFGPNKNYSLTKKDQIEIKLDWNNPRNKKYYKKYTIDLNDTALTITKDIPDESDIIQAYHYADGYYWRGRITTSPLYKDSLEYEFKIYKDNQLVKSFFPYNRINETRFLYKEEIAVLNATNTPSINFVTRPYCDTIYKMIKDSLAPAYQLVLPLENSLPPSFFSRPFKNKTERDNFERNNGWMFHQVYTFYETPQLIYLLVGYLANYNSYIYRKQTNITYKTKNIKPDSSQYGLQLLSDFGTSMKGDKFYQLQKAGDLLSFFEQNKNVPIPKELDSFLKNKPNSTAPIIVEFKLKN